MKQVLLTWCLAQSLTGCNKAKPPDPTGSAAGSSTAAVTTGSGSAGSGSAGSVAGSAGSGFAGSGSGSASADVDPAIAEEAARRKGKKTGLGAPGEKPEVVVEDLLRAIATGKLASKQFIDPKYGVIERISMPGGSDKPVPPVKRTLCRAAAETRTTEYVKAMVDADAKNKADDVSQITCRNEFADKDDHEFGANEMGDKPSGAVPMKQVTCGTSSAGEWSEIAHVVWLPDADRGFRIAAIVSTEGGAITGSLWHDVADELKHAKPCK